MQHFPSLNLSLVLFEPYLSLLHRFSAKSFVSLFLRCSLWSLFCPQASERVRSISNGLYLFSGLDLKVCVFINLSVMDSQYTRLSTSFCILLMTGVFFFFVISGCTYVRGRKSTN